MKRFTYHFIILGLLSLILELTSCYGDIMPPTRYQLNAVSQQKLAVTPVNKTLLVSLPFAAASYQGSDMLYMSKNYQLTPFVKNEWISPPAEMLLPILTQSLQNTGYFYAVVPAPTFARTDWRIDTQLMQLQQDFTQQPSIVKLILEVTLIDNLETNVIASKRFTVAIPSQTDTPYGGVIAANIACQQIMEEISSWAVQQSSIYMHK